MANDEQPPQQQQQRQQHIRPRVQRKSPKAKSNTNDDTNKTDVEIEATRQRMESWMGLGSNNKTTSNSNAQTVSKAAHKTATVITSNHQKPTNQPKSKPASILKTPKYSNKSSVVAIGAPETHGKQSSPGAVVVSADSVPPSTIVSSDNIPDAAKSKPKKSSFICKDIVVERDPSIAAAKRKAFRRKEAATAANSTSIEGYLPGMAPIMPNKATTNRRNDNDELTNGSENNINNKNEPLIIDSLEDLMKAAGQSLPENPDKITPDTKLVEANISFSVMTQDQYETKLPNLKEEQEEERQKQLEMFMGKHDIFDDESLEGQLENDNDSDDDDDDDAVMELLMGSDLDTDDEVEPAERPLQIKAFSLLWEALTNWMTHQTVIYMKSLESGKVDNALREWTPMVDRSDIGASRCAGVLAMLRLYIGQCLEELGHPIESRKTADKRFSDLMRTFDYSRENPKLTAGHWRAMACVLLDACLVETRSGTAKVPPTSVAKMGMTLAEFEYLSRKAVLIFDS
eukprot:CAMPEP_0116104180 /NCGR_PEP_ID=MMETSP0327-20121206/14307_1 /TAXON_ID=44447 /ORGANISM="Pseudo-nitzschia delicatissima, Strain B596" /LENGTH=513 /DNA_ID=CAMNT_0003596393 /DNA_START=107 /DNA_END=1648 /DNA_ORIENTATION=+